ncbi:MAG: hypothetical protein H8D52_02080 [Gammaproteobacteria bacterium]|nr:hypothetical protein [Gammaproteobacteria bacterium]
MKKRVEVFLFIFSTICYASISNAAEVEISHPKDGSSVKPKFLNLHVVASNFATGTELVLKVEVINVESGDIVYEDFEPIGTIGRNSGAHINAKIRDSLPSESVLRVEVELIESAGVRHSADPIVINTK